MKIEFRKVTSEPKEISFSADSVIFEGQFVKMSPTLVRITAKLHGNLLASCYKCGNDTDILIDENLDFLLSDGIYSGDNHEDSIVEIDDHIIDLEKLVNSELISINSEYHCCKNCNSDELFEKEY
jgi:hypothetical protein